MLRLCLPAHRSCCRRRCGGGRAGGRLLRAAARTRGPRRHRQERGLGRGLPRRHRRLFLRPAILGLPPRDELSRRPLPAGPRLWPRRLRGGGARAPAGGSQPLDGTLLHGLSRPGLSRAAGPRVPRRPHLRRGTGSRDVHHGVPRGDPQPHRRLRLHERRRHRPAGRAAAEARAGVPVPGAARVRHLRGRRAGGRGPARGCRRRARERHGDAGARRGGSRPRVRVHRPCRPHRPLELVRGAGAGPAHRGFFRRAVPGLHRGAELARRARAPRT